MFDPNIWWLWGCEHWRGSPEFSEAKCGLKSDQWRTESSNGNLRGAQFELHLELGVTMVAMDTQSPARLSLNH